MDPEESLNLTFGTFFNVGELDVTVDYYNIKVEERLNLSTTRKVCAGQRPAVVDPSCTAYFSDLEGDLLAEARTLQSFKFFINDFDTRTQGVDLVATYPLYWDSGNTDISLAFNHTETKVIKRNPETVGDGRVKEIEEGVPQTRWNLAANHNMDAWRFLGRVSFYEVGMTQKTAIATMASSCLIWRPPTRSTIERPLRRVCRTSLTTKAIRIQRRAIRPAISTASGRRLGLTAPSITSGPVTRSTINPRGPMPDTALTRLCVVRTVETV